MKKKERVFIVVDGSNFYHRLKELSFKKESLNFDYNKFTKWLAGTRKIIEKRYYIGVVRAKPNDRKAQKMRRAQQRLFSRLRNFEWNISRGYILDSSEGYHEKGVDVQIAVDLLVGAYENLYDAVILVSSDTDLLPAIEKVRSMGKKVEYIGFSPKPSYGLIANSDTRRLLIKEDVQEFFKK